MSGRRLIAGAGVLTIAWAASSAWATNGMNLEGYGPVAHSMGGASYAYDNGNAAVINNPATLSLRNGYKNRLDVALGFLGPDVRVSVPGGPSVKSDETGYFMPAFGWTTERNGLVYGVGVFAQGGMGTEYPADSFLALNSGEKVHAEVTFGRVLFPLSARINDRLTVGGTVDFVWAAMDMQMALPGDRAPGLVQRSTIPLPALGATDYLRLDFADDQPWTGEARGYGFAGKIGLTYRLHDRVTLGAVYHSETQVEDLESDDASIRFGSSLDGSTAGTLPGKATVRDFQWPDTYGAGVAIDATDRLMLVAEVKRINWSKTMDSFNLTFEPDAGGSVDLSLPQEWDDQTVGLFGLAFRVTDALTLRGGYNRADNPVPDRYVNPLFPAIVETHYTAGFGFQPNDRHAFHLSAMYAPDTEVVNGDGLVIEHGQLNAQIMYSHTF
jgi:long-chain fatty acid transport protein